MRIPRLEPNANGSAIVRPFLHRTCCSDEEGLAGSGEGKGDSDSDQEASLKIRLTRVRPALSRSAVRAVKLCKERAERILALTPEPPSIGVSTLSGRIYVQDGGVTGDWASYAVADCHRVGVSIVGNRGRAS